MVRTIAYPKPNGEYFKVGFHDLEDGGVDQLIKMARVPISPIELEIFKRFVRPNSIIYDIGAYIGTHSIYLSQFENSKVYAFEPSPRNFPRLVKNCAPYKNIIPLNIAFNNRKYSCETLFKDCNTNTSEDKIVQAINYDIFPNYIIENNLPLPNFIKMDIEGMESVILDTMVETLTSSWPIVLLEAHCAPKEMLTQTYKDNPSWTRVEDGGFDFNILKDLGYLLYEANNSGELIRIYSDINYNEVMGLKTFVLIP